MSPQEDPIASAVVLLRPACGREPDPGGARAETLARHAPRAEAARAAMEFFISAGFETGELVGSSFSISGPGSLFERTFGDRVQQEDREGPPAFKTVHGASELDLTRLPRSVGAHVKAVAFARPLDFGPTSF